MEPRLVVGLFPSSGIAEDARNRLKAEGVPGSEIALAMLQPTVPLLPEAGPETRGHVVQSADLWQCPRDLCGIHPK